MLKSSSSVYFHQGKWKSDATPVMEESLKLSVKKSFSEIMFYYGNVCDYFRILLTLIALFLILNARDWAFTIGFLIIISTLLDWIDGPLARNFNQSTIMGCGWDWCADILTQFCIAVWIIYTPGIPWWFVNFTVFFTAVEIMTGLFDFATGTKGFYPSHPDTIPWWAYSEQLMTPKNTYSLLGIIGWLANTILPVVYCWHFPSVLVVPLIPFALLYAWHEVVQLIFVVSTWKEIAVKRDCGIDLIRVCTGQEEDLLKNSYKKLNIEKPPMEGVLYWNNIFVGGKWKDDTPYKEEMDAFVKLLLQQCYPGQKRYIRSFGFLTSPANSLKSQSWHYDYSATTSNVFVPMTETTARNATQFIRGPRPHPLPESQYYPNATTVRKKENAPYLQLCQMLVPAFTVLKMWECVMHRGIKNGENYDRVMFFLSSDSEPVENSFDVVMDEGFSSTIAGIHEGDVVNGENY